MSHFPLKAKIDKMVRWMAFMKTSYDAMRCFKVAISLEKHEFLLSILIVQLEKIPIERLFFAIFKQGVEL